MANETERDAGARKGAAANRFMERVASGLLGAASGGVLGLLVSGAVGMLRPAGQGTPIALTAALTVGVAVGMAALNLRQKQASQPVAPRAVWGMMLTAAGMLIALVVFLSQSAYIQVVTGSGRRTELPLPVWPISRVALWVSLFSVVGGVGMALLGWAQLAANRGKYGGGRWVAMSILVGGAWAGLALACYIMGFGFPVIG